MFRVENDGSHNRFQRIAHQIGITTNSLHTHTRTRKSGLFFKTKTDRHLHIHFQMIFFFGSIRLCG